VLSCGMVTRGTFIPPTRNGLMRFTKIHFFLTLAATAAVSVSIWRSPKLEFRDRAFPQGFRELVLESAASRLDPLLGLPQLPGVGSKLSAQDVCDALFRDPDSPAIGNPDSEVQIVAFLDYRCPYCRKLTNIVTKVKGDIVRVVYKEWPILGDSSVLAAHAGLAANKQGKYLAFHSRLMGSRLIPTTAYIEDIAVKLGMNLSQLREDMKSSSTALAIQRTSTLASALGFFGTPALVVGRTTVQGEITQNQLERLLAMRRGCERRSVPLSDRPWVEEARMRTITSLPPLNRVTLGWVEPFDSSCSPVDLR
jgi:protein-disulfide isomerase